MQFQSIFQETNEVMCSDETLNHVCVIFICEPFEKLQFLQLKEFL